MNNLNNINLSPFSSFEPKDVFMEHLQIKS